MQGAIRFTLPLIPAALFLPSLALSVQPDAKLPRSATVGTGASARSIASAIGQIERRMPNVNFLLPETDRQTDRRAYGHNCYHATLLTSSVVANDSHCWNGHTKQVDRFPQIINSPTTMTSAEFLFNKMLLSRLAGSKDDNVLSSNLCLSWAGFKMPKSFPHTKGQTESSDR